MIFSYIQIGAKNVDKLADFYIKSLDCQKSDDNKWLNGQKGIVLEAPGYRQNPIKIGIIATNKGQNRAINDKGFAHICFETVDVKAAIKRFVKYGGSFQSTLEKPEGKPCVYCKDIEGNIVEFHIPFPSKDASLFTTLSCLLHLKKDKGIRNEIKPSGLKFIHVNIITDDWRGICDYYNSVVGSRDTGKIKDHSGNFKEKVIGVPGVHVIGKHVLLPGFNRSCPTIEVFNYSIKGLDKPAELDELGFNAIGFKSENINDDVNKFVEAGGELINKENPSLVILKDKNGANIYLGE